MTALTQEKLRQILAYDAQSGIFTWRATIARHVKAGALAGFRQKTGYMVIKIAGRSYRAHRLAWLYVHGTTPPKAVDHINGRRDDNRISNLRLATPTENQHNKSYYGSRSGFKGVRVRPDGTYEAYIQPGGAFRHLGNFADARSAARAYDKAACDLFGAFAKVNFPLEQSHG